MTSIVSAIQKLARAESLDDTLLTASFNALLSGEVPPEQIGAFLMGLAVKGETGKELLAGAKAMRSNARTIKLPGKTLDTCGTGGLGWKSLNTSTASAIVVAACGGKVAKHGNRSVPPKTGSADVLEALGVSIEMSEERFKACIEEIGVGFLFARSHHPAMRHVAPVRASLGIRTIFNLLGPLSNPAKATHQILGVYDPKWLTPMAEALRDLGVEKAWVVHGVSDGNHAIDEISIAGETKIVEVSDGRLHEISLHPEDAGLSRSPLSELEGGAPEENAKAINDLFDGKSTPFSEAVSLNAAAGLYLLDIVDDLTSGVQLANDAILSGKAKEKLSLLVRISNEGE
jgi:anthranilate phosphoribosyltransferase